MTDLREGTTTLLFTDVEGSTDLGDRSGDDNARGLLRRVDDVVREQVMEFGGREVKSLGDGLMVAFHSARKGVACAAAIQCELEKLRETSAGEVPLVRIGLNAGEVILEDDDLFGTAVSAASRICATAGGGEILASEVVKVLAGAVPDVVWNDRGEVTLKGFSEPCRLFRAEWRRETTTSPAGITPFVGRKKERAELRGWLDRLRGGGGGLVAIGGEPGVGKTRLAEELLAEGGAAGFRTLTGRFYEMDSPTPYGALLEVLEAAARDVDEETFRLALGPAAGEIAKVMPHLRHVYEDIPPPLELPPEQERRYLFNSVREFLQRASSVRPIVILFDDVHWADEASLQLMEHVAPELADMPVLILATYRDVELDVYRPLAKTLEDMLRRRLVKRLSLTRLPQDAVAAMLTKLSGSEPPAALTETIYGETEGNAFFVEEVFRHLDEEGRLRDAAGKWRTDLSVDDLEVPEGVRLVIGRRLQRLGEATTKVLTAGAVIGRVFDFRLLEAVAPVDGDELLDCLDEAERTHIVLSRSDGRDAKVVFVHELIRQTLLGGIALPRRQRLHLRVAEAMEKVYADDLTAHAAGIAHHLFQAGAAAEPAKTEEYMVLAGDRAMEVAAFQEALRYFEEALELGGSKEDSERAALLYRIGIAQRSLGLLDQGLASWRQALSLYEAAGDLASVAAVTPEIGLQLGWAARWPEALEISARGLAAVGEDRTADRARLQAIAAIALGWAGDYDNAIAMIEQAVALARDLDDPVLLGEALTVKAAHHFAYVEFDEAAATGEAAVELLRDSAAAWTYASALAFVAVAHYFHGDFDRALSLAEDAVALGHRLGHQPALVFGERVRFFVRGARGGVTSAEWDSFGRRDFDLCRSSGLPFEAYATCFRATACWMNGDFTGAIELLDDAAANEPPGALWGYAQGLRFLVHADAGHRERALALKTDLESFVPAEGDVIPHGIWSVVHLYVEGCSLLDVDAEYERAYELIRLSMERGAAVRWEGEAIDLVAGLAAAGAGLENASEHFERALERSEALGLPVSSSNAARHFAGYLIKRGRDGDHARAKELLDTAAAGYEALGWVPNRAHVERLRASLKGAAGL